MTFYHFGNCIALAYLPYYLAYKHSGLSEYGAFWKCIQTGFIYAFTQLCKMLVLATFFPIPNGPHHESLNSEPAFHDVKDRVGSEFFKDSMDLVDLIGMYIALSRIPGRGHMKVLTAGIGWGTAELLLTRAFAIWVGAKGVEFNWRYIQMALDANTSLVHNVAIAALVWLWSRHDMKPGYYPVVVFLAGTSCYRTLLVNLLSLASLIDPWTVLVIKALVTLVIGACTIKVYSTVA